MRTIPFELSQKMAWLLDRDRDQDREPENKFHTKEDFKMKTIGRTELQRRAEMERRDRERMEKSFTDFCKKKTIRVEMLKKTPKDEKVIRVNFPIDKLIKIFTKQAVREAMQEVIEEASQE